MAINPEASMRLCPFIYGKAVKPKDFFNREKIVSRLLGRILTGQSAAVVGHPHTGKTSLLCYLADKETHRNLAPQLPEEFLKKFHFSYINCQVLTGSFGWKDFWNQALEPVKELTPQISGAFKALEAKAYSAFALENFIKSIDRQGYHLVLLLDEFETLLAHPKLNDPAFYGCLRHLTSLVEGICLVTASRCSLDALNRNTQELNAHGSPYFNTMIELRLGLLPPKAAEKLLERAEDCFSFKDRNFINHVSGGHPYLMQLTAGILWQMDGEEDKYSSASEEIGRVTLAHFNETWRNFSSAEKKVTVAIALNQIPRLVEGHKFKSQKLIKNLTDYEAELIELKSTGLINLEADGEWSITQHAFLWWLANEIKRHTRKENNFTQWISAQELDGILTREEKKKLKDAAKKSSVLIKEGLGALMKQGISKLLG